MPTSAIQLRQLTGADVPFAMRLKNLAGWNQTEADWRRFIELEPQGCFLAEYEGKPAATVTAISYDRRFGWIGMMLVDPERRRLGLASALLAHAVGYLDRQQVETAKLDATPMGKTVYDQYGFKDEYIIERRFRPLSSAANANREFSSNVGASLRLATGRGSRGPDRQSETGSHIHLKTHDSCARILPRDLDGIAEFDAPWFGADRRRLLATLLRDAPEFCYHTDGGFVMGRRGTKSAQIGPLVAMDAVVAERLLLAALGATGNVPAILDVPLCNAAADSLSTKLGFEKQRELIRQYRGPNRYTGDCRRIFGIAGPELG